MAMEQLSTMGTAMVLPGRADMAVGMVWEIWMATIMPISQAKSAPAGRPASTRMIVMGTMVAVSSVPGMMPMRVYSRPPATAATMAIKISVMFSCPPSHESSAGTQA